MNKSSTKQYLMPFIAAVLLSGCASTKSSHLYVLSAPVEVAAGKQIETKQLKGVPIILSRVVIPKHLDRPSIVTHQGEVELAYSEYHRWGEPLADNMTDVLALNLGDLIPSAVVIKNSIVNNLEAGFRVHCEVLRMTGDLGKEAVLEIRWGVLDGADKHLLDTSISNQHVTLDNASYESYVSAISRMLTIVSEEIANSLEKVADAKK